MLRKIRDQSASNAVKGIVTLAETRHAEETWLKIEQRKVDEGKLEHMVCSLEIFTDSNRILRVRGRVDNFEDQQLSSTGTKRLASCYTTDSPVTCLC